MRLPALTLLPIVFLLGGCSVDLAPSNVKVSERPAAGLTESSFDQGFLTQLAEETRQSAQLSLQQAYERNNIPPAERYSQARTEGRYEWFGERQLAVVELGYSANPMRVTRVVGVVDDRLVTVSCISPLGEPTDLRAADGECAEALRTHFSRAGTK